MKKCLCLLMTMSLFLLMSLGRAEEIMDNSEDKEGLHVYNDIDLISSINEQYPSKHTTIKYVYPTLESDSDNPYVENFNQMVKNIIQETIAQFKQEVKTTPKMNGGEKNDLNIDYDALSLHTNGNHIISVRFIIQGYIAPMAHPYHRYAVINYNLDTGETLKLSDLFKTDSNYLTVLSNYSREVLAKRFKDQKMIETGTAPTPDHFKNWNIKPNGLMITFDEATVAPYVNGAQSVLIPFNRLNNIIAPASPLARCVNKGNQCTRSDLLTGGFIDSLGA